MTGFSEHRSADSRGEADVPPQPPVTRRRLALTRKQWIGLPLIAAIPVLTLFGLFGEHHAEIRVSSRRVAVAVRYPDRFRYRQTELLTVTVRNIAGSDIDTVHVSLDTAYVTRFAGLRIEPQPSTAFTVDLAHVKPGESRLVTAEYSGDRYGRHRGRVVISTSTDTATATISTFVFP